MAFTLSVSAQKFAHRSFTSPYGSNGELAASIEDDLAEFYSDPQLEDFSPFVEALANPNYSDCHVSIRANYMTALWQHGYWSDCIEQAEIGFNQMQKVQLDDLSSQHRTTALSFAVKLLEIYSRVGEKTEVAKIIAYLEKQTLDAESARQLTTSRGAFFAMTEDAGHSFKCGPLAVGNAYRVLNDTQKLPASIISIRSTEVGFNLSQCVGFAQDVGLTPYLRYAEQIPQEIPTPCVVHWKAGHYASLTEEKDGLYHFVDPTFKRDFWMSREAVLSSASGYFIFFEEPASVQWESVEEGVADSIFGKGAPNMAEEDDQGDDSCDKGCGMPAFSIDQFYLHPVVRDTPVYFTDPVLGQVGFTVRYAESSNYGRFSTGAADTERSIVSLDGAWTSNWTAYASLSSPTATDVRVLTPGGASRLIARDGSGRDLFSQATITDRGSRGFRYNLPDGSVYTYNRRAQRSGATQFFLTSYKPASFADGKLAYEIRYKGSSGGIISSVNFEGGNSLVFHYDRSGEGHRSLITRVSVTEESVDGSANVREAILTLDESGRLQSISDAEENVSSFAYGGGEDFSKITQIITPHGTTKFGRTRLDNDVVTDGRFLSVTDAKGQDEYYLFANVFLVSNRPDLLAGVFPPGTTVVDEENPDGIDVAIDADIAPGQPIDVFFGGHQYPRYGTTLHWGKIASKHFTPNTITGDNFDKATQTRWIGRGEGNSTIFPVPSSIRPPLESRIFFLYDQQPDAARIGPSTNVTHTVRTYIDDDGTKVTQISENEYTENGFIKSSTDPLGRKTIYTYDEATGIDLVSIQQQAAGSEDVQTLQSFYDYERHLPGLIADGGGFATELTYDDYGRMLTSTRHASLVSDGELSESSPQLASRYVFDPDSLLLSSIQGSSADDVSVFVDTASFPSYTFGLATESVDELEGYSVSYEFDRLERLTRTAYPDGTDQTYVFDRLVLQESTDREGRRTQYKYNGNLEMVAMIDPLNRITAYHYCACGDLEILIDANSNKTEWHRDLQKRVIRKTYPDGKEQKWTFDAIGRPKTATNARGHITTRSYFPDDLIQQITYSDGTPTETYSWDQLLGRPLTMTDGIGTTSYSYAPYSLGSLGAGQASAVDGPWPNDTVSSEFDELGRLVAYQYKDDSGVVLDEETYTFDFRGRILKTENPLATYTARYVNQGSRVEAIDSTGPLQVSYDYFEDAVEDFRLKTIKNSGVSGKLISQFDYAYRSDGIITEWSQNLGSSGLFVQNFTYDKADQLRSVSSSGAAGGNIPNYDFLYDRTGNHLTRRQGSSYSTGTHNSRNQRVSEGANGQLPISGSTATSAIVSISSASGDEDFVAASEEVLSDDHGYFETLLPVTGAIDRLKIAARDPIDGSQSAEEIFELALRPNTSRALAYDEDGNTLSSGEFSYTWDAKSRLTRISYADGAYSKLRYDSSDRNRIIEEYDASNRLIDVVKFIWCGARRCEERSADDVVRKRYFFGGERRYSGESAQGRFYTSVDHLGSSREMLDEAGVTRSRYVYRPYGERQRIEGDLECSVAFTGHWLHERSELSLAWFRAYSATLGLWLSPDPLGEGVNAMGNLYNYVANDPLNNWDPFGLADMNMFSPSETIGFMPSNTMRNSAANHLESGGSDYFNIASHSSPQGIYDDQNGILYTDQPLGPGTDAKYERRSVKDLADRIKNHPNYDPTKKIVLNSCCAGLQAGGIAAQLSNQLPNQVVAKHGLFEYAKYYTNRSGEWSTFQGGRRIGTFNLK